MKKWFEWQQLNQHVESDVEYIVNNVREHCHIITDWITNNLSQFQEQYFYSQQEYHKKLSQSYPEISIEKIQEWISDPEFDFLLKQTARYDELTLPWETFQTFNSQCNNLFDIESDNSEIVITRQKPGQTSPVHYDRRKSTDYGLNGQENRISRWLVMLEDQHPGQCFLMNKTFLTWKMGDVISWPNTELPHGASNFGFYDRYTLRITGKLR